MKALYTGSFDPITYGHLDIIEKSSNIFDTVTVGIIVNPNKTSLFTLEERMETVKNLVKEYPNVDVDCFQGLLADYVNSEGFGAVIRGLRGISDLSYETQMAYMNDKLFDQGVETVFLLSDHAHSFISSSMVKEVASLGGSIDQLVPEEVKIKVLEKYNK